MTEENEFLCSECQMQRPWSAFPKRRGIIVRPLRCRQCRRAQQNASRRRYARDPEKFRRYYLERTFGITVEDYDGILARQGGVCAICREARRSDGSGRRLAVDHDHETGEVRGLLCGSCNRALGRLEARLDALLGYLSDPPARDVISRRKRAAV
jgi:hypothetical protein